MNKYSILIKIFLVTDIEIYKKKKVIEINLDTHGRFQNILQMRSAKRNTSRSRKINFLEGTRFSTTRIRYESDSKLDLREKLIQIIFECDSNLSD